MPPEIPAEAELRADAAEDEYEVRAHAAEDEYEVRAHAARPVLAAIAATADALPPGGPRTLLLYLAEGDRLFDPDLTPRTWLLRCRIRRSAVRDLFRSSLGVTPGDFLKEARLEVGVAMLAASDLKVRAIGQLLGFGDSTFERVFERSTGSAPSDCRPWLRGLCGRHADPGLLVLSRKVLLGLAEGTAPAGVYRAITRLLLRRYFELMSDPGLDLLEVLEKRLAAELWELRLAPEPNRAVVEACRAYFRTTALDDLLAEKGWPPEKDPRP